MSESFFFSAHNVRPRRLSFEDDHVCSTVTNTLTYLYTTPKHTHPQRCELHQIIATACTRAIQQNTSRFSIRRTNKIASPFPPPPNHPIAFAPLAHTKTQRMAVFKWIIRARARAKVAGTANRCDAFLWQRNRAAARGLSPAMAGVTNGGQGRAAGHPERCNGRHADAIGN